MTEQATKTQQKQDKKKKTLSFFIVFNHVSVAEVSFCGLTKGISPKICIRVKINKHSFEPFCVWIL